MKIEVTNAIVTNDMGVVATVQLFDGNVVQVDIKQYVGWNDWLDLTDAVRKAMVLMGVKQ